MKVNIIYKMEDNDYIQEILNNFAEPNPEELKKELEKAKNLKNKNKFIKSFIKKYSNNK